MRERYQRIASALVAMENCRASGNLEWELKHEETIHAIVKNELPSGSGFDAGTKIDLERSKPNKLVFAVDFHHMDENGFYDGWTAHEVIITPSLAFGFEIRVTGRDRNDIKDYIAEVFA